MAGTFIKRSLSFMPAKISVRRRVRGFQARRPESWFTQERMREDTETSSSSRTIQAAPVCMLTCEVTIKSNRVNGSGKVTRSVELGIRAIPMDLICIIRSLLRRRAKPTIRGIRWQVAQWVSILMTPISMIPPIMIIMFYLRRCISMSFNVPHKSCQAVI